MTNLAILFLSVLVFGVVVVVLMAIVLHVRISYVLKKENEELDRLEAAQERRVTLIQRTSHQVNESSTLRVRSAAGEWESHKVSPANPNTLLIHEEISDSRVSRFALLDED